jgi:rhodanese-related sulfurtransferase
MAASITPDRLFELLRAESGEIAVLDVREEGRFGDGHILVASALPLSRIEQGIELLVPRKETAIVVYDDTDGLAVRACDKLASLGYTGVMVLDGGLPGWIAAGYEVYEGLNTPSKALGVFAHREFSIPEIVPDGLAGLMEAGGNVAVLDCRPFTEYQNGSIPGASNCPGAALIRNAAGAAGDADTLVITCAGRTRGLAGAQTLRDFGYRGQVFALRDGTMGWQLSGRTVERNAGRSALSDGLKPASADLMSKAEAIRHMAGIGVIDTHGLARLRADAARTVYVFDIRERPDWEAGHIAGARHVAGGQLVQNLDMHAAVRGARIVVSDDDVVSATGVALWLRRMGWRDVFVAPLDNGGFDTAADRDKESAATLITGSPASIDPATLKQQIGVNKPLVVDLASSREYRKGHIPGAWFVVRSRLPDMLSRLPKAATLVLTSEDGALAALAAHDDLPFPGAIHVLAGGTAAWRNAGYDLSTDLEQMIDRPDDVVVKPTELPAGPERDEAMRVYLGGSEELLEKVEREGLLKLAALPVD